MTADRVAAAVADGAAWCDAVCRWRGRTTSRTPTVWSTDDPPRWSAVFGDDPWEAVLGQPRTCSPGATSSATRAATTSTPHPWSVVDDLRLWRRRP